ncbi:MAG: ABC transporter substrate-binding protein [Treponema sp.]|nr:ABC transporter substrate-binding protein [Treponema sp.]
MKKMIQKVVLAVGMFVLAGEVSFAAKKQQKVVRIGSASGATRQFDGTLGVGKELGYVEEELKKVGYGVEWIAFANGPEVNEAFIANALDVSGIGDIPALTGFSNGIGVSWIGNILANNDKVIAVKKGSSIKTPKDLEGKSIAVGIGTDAHYTIEKFIEGFNLDHSKINLVNLVINNGIASVLSGAVDAVVGNTAVLLPLVENGELEVLFSTVEKQEWSTQIILVGRDKFLKDNPKAVKALFTALLRAHEEIVKNPEKYYVTVSAQKIAKAPQLGPQLFNIDGGKFINLHPQVQPKAIETEQSIYDFFYSIGRIKTQKNLKDFYKSSYYESAKK